MAYITDITSHSPQRIICVSQFFLPSASEGLCLSSIVPQWADEKEKLFYLGSSRYILQLARLRQKPNIVSRGNEMC